jgi:hypothetical protein
MLFDLLGVQLSGPRAEGKHIVINWNFTDPQGSCVLTQRNWPIELSGFGGRTELDFFQASATASPPRPLCPRQLPTCRVAQLGSLGPGAAMACR